MEYRELVELYERIDSTTKRLEKTALIADFLRSAKAEEVPFVVHLLQGRVFPQWDERNIGFSSRLMLKAIAKVTGESVKGVEKEWSKRGDLGLVTEHFLQSRKQRTLFSQKLDVRKVVVNLQKLAGLEGEGTVEKKVGLVAELLSSASPVEARYVVRTVLEVLRIGIAGGVVRDAIASAFNESADEVERAFEIVVDYGEVAQLAKQKKLGGVELKPGKPLKLMLAVLVKDVSEGFERVGKPAEVEFKYDGMRVQVHKKGDHVELFTRSMENVTRQFPELVEYVKECVGARECILDGEALGFSSKTKKYLPFQMISQRIKRKYNISEVAKEFPVELKVFDVVFLNGKSVVNENFEKRRKLMEGIVNEKKWCIVLAERIVSSDEAEVKNFFERAVREGHEGVMFKSLSATYKPGRYVGYMAKLKQVMETLDVVITKAEWGEGKRASWLSSYTVSCQKDGKLFEVGKVSTGLKELEEEGVTFEAMTKLLKPLITSQSGKEVVVKPKVVVEVAYEEIQKSPTYTSQYALRFPRIVNVRLDKPVSEIAELDEVVSLFKSQKK